MILRLATVVGHADEESRVASELASAGDAELIMRCLDRVEALAVIRSQAVDAIIAVGLPTWVDLELLAEAREQNIRVLALADRDDRTDSLDALGVEFLAPNARLEEIIERCAAAKPPTSPVTPAEPKGQGSIVSVWGAKGAPGRSTVALQLALTYAACDSSAALVDADPYGGDILQMAGVTELVPSIIWACRGAARDDSFALAFMEELKTLGEGGPILLPGISRAELWADVSLFGWERLLTAMPGLVERTVVDVGFCFETDEATEAKGGGGRNRIARATLRAADRVLAVVRGDPVGLKQFLWAYEDLTDLVDPDRVAIVVNRVTTNERAEVARVIERQTGKRVTASIPEVPHAAWLAQLHGRGIAERDRRGELGDAFQELAALTGSRVRPRGALVNLVRGVIR